MNASRAVVVCALVLGAVACVDESSPSSGSGWRELPGDHTGLSLSIDVWDGSVLRARVRGDTVHTWEESGRMLFIPLEVELFDEAGDPTGFLTADRGEMNTRTERMLASGHVVLTSADSARKVLTDTLHYDPDRDRIWSDAHTTLVDGGSRLEGSGFRSNASLTELEVLESTGVTTEAGGVTTDPY